MKRDQITEQMKRLMSASDQARYGEPALGSPAGEAQITLREREHHGIFENWLISNGYSYRHSRTDKKTRETVGAPDFSVYQRAIDNTTEPVTKALLIEFKLPGNKLSAVQEKWAAQCGGIVHVVASAKEAIELVRQYL